MYHFVNCALDVAIYLPMHTCEDALMPNTKYNSTAWNISIKIIEGALYQKIIVYKPYIRTHTFAHINTHSNNYLHRTIIAAAESDIFILCW